MIARRLFVASALPLVAGLSLRPGEAEAQQPQPGRVTARSFDPVAAGATIEVSPLDDRQENLRLAAEFSRRLAALTLGIQRVADAKQSRGLFP